MDFLAPFHPQIVHTPVALIITGAVFELIGRTIDIAWWRKAAFAMLILGTLGAGLAVLSGEPASERAEKGQGVPEQAVDAHEDLGKLTWWIAAAAVLARMLAGRLKVARGPAAGLALMLHLAAAVTVAMAAHRGGVLVYEHAAGVRLHGKPVLSGRPHRESHPEGREQRR